jgi:hypothetical protein
VRPTQNTVIHGLLGATVLLGTLLLYLVLAHHGQTALPLSRWILFGGIALALETISEPFEPMKPTIPQ